ncbi:unnamed protein product [Cochlearia groenlandica]
MANRSVQKIRLVKCPKCLKILQEDEDVLVYRCGGCSAILQAKKQNTATDSTPSDGESGRAKATSEPETRNNTLSSLEEEEEEDKSIGLSVDHVVIATENSPDASSPVEEKQDQLIYENQLWNDLQSIRSNKFEIPKNQNRVNHEEKGASSSSTFSQKRRNGFTTYSKWNKTRSQQLEGQGGFLGRQGRRYVTEQLRPNMPFYPRKPYKPSHNEFDRYSLQMPPYNGRIHQECVAKGYGQGFSFTREMTCDTRNHTGYYTSQVHNSYTSYSTSPQRPTLQQQHDQYHQRWRHKLVSDHHHELQQNRGLKERQRVAKHHVRSISGGAPFVSCYNCYETLNLPVGFLIFNKKKYHMLRCGTCNTVLRFSLESRTHLVPVIITHDVNVTNKSSVSTLESVSVERGSPLHRLMGYSTLSQVFKASQRPPSII